MTRVLLLGGHGLIGRALQLALIKTNIVFEVGTRKPKGDSDLVLDYDDPIELGQAFSRFTHVVNLAAQTSGEFSSLLEVNTALTQRLLDAAFQLAHPPKITLIGSAAEYGAADESPIPETAILKPTTTYGLSKAMQTEILLFYSRRGLPVNLARVFNVEATDLPDTSLLGNLDSQISRVKAGLQSSIELGRLEGSRDYLPVETVAEGILQVLMYGKPGEIYNVCSGVETNIRDLVLNRLAEGSLDIEILREVNSEQSSKSANVLHSVGNPRKLRELMDR